MATDTTQASARDYETRRLLTMAAMRLFDLWQLTNQQQLLLLDYSIRYSTLIGRYRRGAVIQKNSRAISRIRLLLAIYRKLNRHYPEDVDGMRHWLTTAQLGMDGRSPLEVMCLSSNRGLIRIMHIL